ncbi:MAG TPA: MotA/TolQ/ExbB proton channel family protein [Sulfurimonas sp.]|uniref:MotA/TolQ/ExbB proton channel family protein n=1 Tax=Sulfurimonas sp. TaxID=2022749 RepID=UPI002BE2A144|nr:MotA/TolQ/ExbB proton channel family protein [Sulfurimonas sp.]HUH42642.1 MotA/TolQ/ExbB proton channel family protein [Sulfurimonas sp.]
MIDTLMYTLSQLFLTPTLVLILLMFVYSFIALGSFAYEGFSRKRHSLEQSTSGAYPILHFYNQDSTISMEKLELFAHKRLEHIRNVSRIAPMMGLIATLIPLGPALKALTDGNITGMSEGLIIAFSAVTLGLIAASLTYWIGNVKKRWYADELHSIEVMRAG